MAVDTVGDIVSGIAAVGIYSAAVAAAPFTGGLSIVAGVFAASASGAAIKTGVKYADAKVSGKDYTAEDIKHDALTGGISGLLAPVTGGLGGAAGKAVATRFGVQAVKQVGKEVAEEVAETGAKAGLKVALLNPTGYEYVGGKFIKRAAAMGAEMATDGALGGAIDGGFRAGLDSKGDAGEIVSGLFGGFLGGLTMAPLIGGGMKAAGKGAQKVFGKHNIRINAQNKKVRDDIIYDFIDGKIDENYAAAVLRDVDDFESAILVVEKRIKKEDRPKLEIAKKKLQEKINKNIKDHGSIVLQSEIPSSSFTVDPKSGVRYARASQNDMFLVHAVPEGKEVESISYLIHATRNPEEEVYASLSLANKNSALFGDQNGYLGYGIIPVSKSTNVTSAGFGQVSSYKKDFSTFVMHQSFENLPEENLYLRNSFLRNLKKKGYDLSEDDFVVLFNKLKDKEYFSEITEDIKIGDKILKADELRDALELSHIDLSKKFIYGNDSNTEVSSIIYGIRAIYARADEIDAVSPEIKKLANENGIDIILLGKPTKLDISTNPEYQAELKSLEQSFKDGKITLIQRMKKRAELKNKYESPEKEKLRAKSHLEQIEAKIDMDKKVLNDAPKPKTEVKSEGTDTGNAPVNGAKKKKTAVDILSEKIENAKNKDDIISIKQHIKELDNETDKKVLQEKYLQNLQKFVPEKEANLIKKIMSNTELKQHPVVLDLLDKVIQKEHFEVDEMFDMPNNIFGTLLSLTRLKEPYLKIKQKNYIKKGNAESNELLDVLNTFVDNPILYQNPKMCEVIAEKADYGFYKPKHAKFVKEGMELYINTKEFQESPAIQNNLEIFFADISSVNKAKLLNFVKDHPNIKKNDIAKFINNYSEKDDLDAILRICDKNNTLDNILSCLGDTEPQVKKARLHFLEKYGNISLSNIHKENYKFLMKLSEDNVSPDFLKKYIDVLNENNFHSIQKLDKKGDISADDIMQISRWITKQNKKFIDSLCDQGELSPNVISDLAQATNNRKMCLNLAKELCDIPGLPKDHIHRIITYARKDNLSIIREFCQNKDIQNNQYIADLINYSNRRNKNFVIKMCKDKKLSDRDIEFITASSRDQESYNLITKMYESKDIDKKYLKQLVEKIYISTERNNIKYLEKLYFNKDISKELLVKLGYYLETINENNAQFTEYLLLNYKKLGVFEEQIATLIKQNEVFDLSILSKLNKTLGKDKALQLNENELIVCINNFDIINKASLSDLTKTQKRNLLNTLLVNKSLIESSNLTNLHDVIPILPQNTKDYVKSIDLIKNSLHMNGNGKLSIESQKSFNESLSKLTTLLKDSKNIDDIQLLHPQDEFITKINSILKDLPQETQLKIQNLFGFEIINGKLTGYPNVNIHAESIENKALLNQIKKEVEIYLNNGIVIKNNLPLSNVLNSIIKDCPELLNQIDGNNNFTKVLQQLQTTLSKKEFMNLSDNDKQIVILAHLLGNTDKNVNTRVDMACEGYYISQNLGFSKTMSQKLYSVIEMLNAPDMFMSTSKKKTVKNYRGTVLEGQEREDTFDLIAFKLKEGNLFNLTKLIYESNYPEGLTDRFNKLLSRRIKEIKSNDFVLLQTASSTYKKYAQKKDILNKNKVYSVDVVDAKDIPNFYAIAHTPEAGFATGGSRDANFANFKLFEMIGDDKVVCAGYITAENAGLVRNYHHGFIFEVPNDKQYVGYGTDIYSLSKNIPDMLVEYFRDRGYKANKNRGDKWAHRTFISKILKRELYGVVGSELKGVDSKYVARLDNIKKALGDKPLTLGNLQEIDPEFAKAYEKGINSKGLRIFLKKLLNKFSHNEILVSNPKIAAIFTDDIDNIPEEYLIKAQEENLPIVIVK